MVWQTANKERKSFLTLKKSLRVGKEINIETLQATLNFSLVIPPPSKMKCLKVQLVP